MNPAILAMMGCHAATSVTPYRGGAVGALASTVTVSLDLGPVETSRRIVIAVGSVSNGTLFAYGLTVAGSAASLVVQTSSGWECAALYAITVTSGGTASVVVTFNRPPTYAPVVYAYSLPATATVTDTDQISAATPAASRTLTTTAGGFLIAVSGRDAACTWTGASRDGELAAGRSVASAATTGADITVSNGLTYSGLAVATFAL